MVLLICGVNKLSGTATATRMATTMEDFFFGEGSALPPEYVPQQAK